MAIGFKHGTSGSDVLGITVVPGTTKPSSPKENTIWANSSSTMGSFDISPTEPPRVSKTKNLTVYPWFHTTRTENGLTFTDNKDGTVKVNGTATATTYFRMSYTRIDRYEFVIQPGTYHLSGAPSGGSRDTHYLCLGYSYDDWGSTKWVYDTGSGDTFTVEKEAKARISIEVKSGAKLSNLVYKPQLERGSAATSFVKGDASGQIWVKTAPGGSVLMDALKGKNSIYFQPGAVYEYTASNGWVKRDAQVYQYGAWKDIWDGYFFKAGNQYTDITGGWTTEGWTSTVYSLAGNAAINDDHLYVQTWGGSICQLGTVNKVDLTGISTLKASVTIQTAGDVVVCVSSSKSHTGSAASKLYSAKGTYTYSVDVSNLSGSYYIIIYALSTGGSTPDAKITNVWGE